ncbi:hypothetical protein ALC56_06332 [Trachymyrmex septentrionalis]|uniref:Peptidase A2 domain-containing protein n=1 Tax=Trachymyrmex septentrionalis TaxID=34720 RepID=A0A151JWX6_9HYME|nr:hypothetical protein ALC56_06332 [Trachymyrmex septentrionalis]
MPVITLMLDAGSGPNVIKGAFIPKNNIVDYNNILKLNGINKYPVYTFGKITLSLFGKEVIFHTDSSKIDYVNGYLDKGCLKMICHFKLRAIFFAANVTY